MKILFICFYAALIISAVIFTTSCSMTDEQRDKIIDIVQRIPTPTATPAPTATPTPIPAPTPVPDVSVGAALAGVQSFADANDIPVVSTGRGDMLDLRGRGDSDALIAEWCGLSGGAACPALTDAEPRGIFHQCQ